MGENDSQQASAPDELSTGDIIRADLARDGNREDWRDVMTRLQKMVASNKYRVIRAGNTLYAYEIGDGKDAKTWSFSADDDVQSFINSGDQFFQTMKKVGFKTVTFDTNRQAMLRLLKQKQYQFESSTSGPIDPVSGSALITVKVTL